jgi:hypothetical protein
MTTNAAKLIPHVPHLLLSHHMHDFSRGRRFRLGIGGGNLRLRLHKGLLRLSGQATPTGAGLAVAVIIV